MKITSIIAKKAKHGSSMGTSPMCDKARKTLPKNSAKMDNFKSFIEIVCEP
jgi:hypothetical protein